METKYIYFPRIVYSNCTVFVYFRFRLNGLWCIEFGEIKAILKIIVLKKIYIFGQYLDIECGGAVDP